MQAMPVTIQSPRTNITPIKIASARGTLSPPQGKALQRLLTDELNSWPVIVSPDKKSVKTHELKKEVPYA